MMEQGTFGSRLPCIHGVGARELDKDDHPAGHEQESPARDSPLRTQMVTPRADPPAHTTFATLQVVASSMAPNLKDNSEYLRLLSAIPPIEMFSLATKKALTWRGGSSVEQEAREVHEAVLSMQAQQV